MVREALSGSSFYGTPLYWWLQTPKQVCGLCNQRYRLCGYYKKALKVFSVASFPEACCRASLAFFTFCQLFSMALRTAFLIRMVHERFSASSRTCLQPLDALHLEAFQPWVTEMCVISVCTPTSLEVKPWDFNRRTRQRIRYAWLLPWRKPSSNCRLSDIN